MQRPIKFRAWDKNNKIMSDPFSLDDVAEDYDCGYYVPNGYKKVDFYGEDAPVMQFTGLKDSDNAEIYEGDIVDFTYWWFDGNEAESHLTGEVVYLPEAMSFGLRGVKNADWIKHIGGEEGSSDTAPFATWSFAEDDFRVIGNIYSNPELLESPKEDPLQGGK